jgi:hypothetical protein
VRRDGFVEYFIFPALSCDAEGGFRFRIGCRCSAIWRIRRINRKTDPFAQQIIKVYHIRRYSGIRIAGVGRVVCLRAVRLGVVIGISVTGVSVIIVTGISVIGVIVITAAGISVTGVSVIIAAGISVTGRIANRIGNRIAYIAYGITNCIINRVTASRQSECRYQHKRKHNDS